MNLANLFNLKGRSALVTGSTRGIGRSIALALAEAGADVAIHGSQPSPNVDAVCSEVRERGATCAAVVRDLAEAEASRYIYTSVVEAFGKLDILVANASVQLPTPWQEATDREFDQQVTVNLKSPYELMQLAAPAMQQRGWGRILTIGSVQEHNPSPVMMVYAATKSAQANMSRNLARELAASGVTVNNLAPGVIGTDRNADRLADSEHLQDTLDRIPLGRIGEPEDCAPLALLLCSDAGSYITGQNIFVDGGWNL